MSTDAMWMLVKYQPDVRRGEPRNVGVIVSFDGDVQTRFLGETENGRIDGRTIGSVVESVDNYKSWVAYFKRAVSQGRFDSMVHRWQERRHESNFYLSEPGVMSVNDHTPDIASLLFAELVGPRITGPGASHTSEDELISTVFSRLSVQPIVRPSLRVDAFGISTPISFDYGYQNGRFHLMDHLRLGSTHVSARKSAYDFVQRAQFAKTAGWSESFVLFYAKPNKSLGDDAEAALKIADHFGYSVDLSDLDEATATTGAILSGEPRG